MQEQKSSAYVADTSANLASGGMPGVRVGDLAPDTILEREVIDVSKVGDTWRTLEPGAFTIKAGS